MECLRVSKGIAKAVIVIMIITAFVCLYKIQNDEMTVTDNGEYAHSYSSKMQEKLDGAAQVLHYSLFSDKHSFFYLNTIKYSKDIKRVLDVEVRPANTAAVEKLLEYSFVPTLFAFIMLTVSMQFLLETQNGMKKIIRAAVRGRFSLAAKRTGIMAGICAVLSLAFNFITFGILLLFYGGAMDLLSPIQSVPIFSLFPYKINILQFFYLYCLFFAVAMFAVGQLLYLVMQSTNMNKFSYIAIIFIFGLEFVLYFAIPSSSARCFLKYINLIYFLMPGMALLYENWGNNAFVTDIYSSTTLAALVLVPVLVLANHLLYVFKYETRESKLLFKLQEVPQRILEKMNSLFLEAYKILFLQFGIVIIAVFMILLQDTKIMRGVNVNYNYYQSRFYDQYSGEMPGEETDAYIEALKAERLEKLQGNGYVQKEAMEKLQEAIIMLETQSSYLRAQNEKGIDARFVNPIVYNDIFGERLYNNQASINLLCIIAVILAIGGTFAYERKHNMVSIFNACANRHRVAQNKAAVTAMLVFIIWALSFALNWMNILDIYTLEHSELPIQSLQQFENFGLRVNMWGYIIFCQLFRLFWLLVIGFTVLAISAYFDYAGSIALSLILLLPHLLYMLRFEALKVLSPVVLLDYTRIFYEENANPVLNISYFILYILIILEICFVKKRKMAG